MRRYPSGRRTIVGLMAIAVTALTAAGCGSGDASTSAPESTSGASSEARSTSSTAASARAETVAIAETEYKLAPASVTVKPGTVTFDVSNVGSTVHNLEVESPSGDQEIEGDLEPGGSGKLTVDLTQPGTYEMYCPVDGHKDLGMSGEITVKR